MCKALSGKARQLFSKHRLHNARSLQSSVFTIQFIANYDVVISTIKSLCTSNFAFDYFFQI